MRWQRRLKRYSSEDQAPFLVTRSRRSSRFQRASLPGRRTSLQSKPKSFRQAERNIFNVMPRFGEPQVLADTENLNTADDAGRTVLMWACERADVAAVRELIRFGADVRTKDSQGRTAMMYAAARQSPELVDALLHFHAGVNEQDSSGETALHFAAGLASPHWTFLNPVADYSEPPTANFWPYLFTETPNPEVVAHLLSAGADPNAVDFEGATPLMYAADGGTREVLRALLAAGTDPDAQDAEGRTALMYAADHCQTESVRLLVQARAEVTLKDNHGYTALKRVQLKLSRFGRRLCRADRKQIIHILWVAHTSR
jgi:hypothetical protein